MSGINPFFGNLLLQKVTDDLGQPLDTDQIKNLAEAKDVFKSSLKFAAGGAVVAGLSYLGFANNVFGYGYTSLMELANILVGTAATAVCITGVVSSVQAHELVGAFKEQNAADVQKPGAQPKILEEEKQTNSLSPHCPSPAAGHHHAFGEIKVDATAAPKTASVAKKGPEHGAGHAQQLHTKPGRFEP